MQELDRAVEFYLRNSIADSTQKAYSSAKRRYIDFCSSSNLPPLPTSYLANSKLSHTTMKCYLAGVRHLHITQGYGDPHMSSMAKLELVLRGIKSTQTKQQGPSKRTRLPITIELLHKLKGAWDRPDTDSGPMSHRSASLASYDQARSRYHRRKAMTKGRT